MERYKPEYLGKVIPVDDTSKLTDFVTNKYDSFSKIYDTCKEQSQNISDIKVVGSENDSLTVKLTCSQDTAEQIKKTALGDNTISIIGDIVTARSS